MLLLKLRPIDLMSAPGCDVSCSNGRRECGSVGHICSRPDPDSITADENVVLWAISVAELTQTALLQTRMWFCGPYLQQN